MESLSHLTRRFEAIPRLLRLIVIASLGVGVAIPIVLLIPGSRFDLAGHKLSLSQLWETRVAYALIVGELLAFVVAIGIFIRGTWVRPLLIFLPVLQTLPLLAVHWLYGAPDPIVSGPAFTAMSVAWALAASAYLFGARSARAHFAGPAPP